MKIVLIYVNNKNSVHDEAINEYKKRLSRYADFDEMRICHSDIKTECENVEKKLEAQDYVVLLDETGSNLSSIDFAEFVDIRQNNSTKRLVFVIGGADGATPPQKKRGNFLFFFLRPPPPPPPPDSKRAC
jgi:23S rRNA (pseudouridine1915-N3)-methyltransferase